MKKLILGSVSFVLIMVFAIPQVPSLDLGTRLLKVSHMAGGDENDIPMPGIGSCAAVGAVFPDNPFYGWPTALNSCKWSTITAWFCDPNYGFDAIHWGIDIAYPGVRGDPVVTTTDDALVRAAVQNGEWNRGKGNYVELEALACRRIRTTLCCLGGDCDQAPVCNPAECDGTCVTRPVKVCRETGWTAFYLHLLRTDLRRGQRIARGDIIGRIGSTGNSTGPHLHYEINAPGGEAVDPQPTVCLLQ